MSSNNTKTATAATATKAADGTTAASSSAALQRVEAAWRRFEERSEGGLLITNVALDVSCIRYLMRQLQQRSPRLRLQKLCLLMCTIRDDDDDDEDKEEQEEQEGDDCSPKHDWVNNANQNVWQAMAEFMQLASATLRNLQLDCRWDEVKNGACHTSYMLEAIGNAVSSSGRGGLGELELTSLTLRGTEHGRKLQRILANNPNLVSLKLLGCRMDQDSMRELAQGLGGQRRGSSSLKVLCLNACHMDSTMLQILVHEGLEKRNKTRVQHLELCRNKLSTAAALPPLSNILKFQDSLCHLDLSGNVGFLNYNDDDDDDDNSNDDHDEQSGMRRSTRLQLLQQFFNALRGHSRLLALDLVSVQLGDETAKLLFEALEGKACPLRSLDLLHNPQLDLHNPQLDHNKNDDDNNNDNNNDAKNWFDCLSKLQNLRQLFLPSTLKVPFDRVAQVLCCNTSLVWLQYGGNTEAENRQRDWFLRRNRFIHRAVTCKNVLHKALWPSVISALLEHKKKREQQQQQQGGGGGTNNNEPVVHHHHEAFYTFVKDTHTAWI